MKPATMPAKAKSVIFLFMYGGPSHIDTFDYKPEMVGMDNKTIDVKTFGRGGQEEPGPHRRTALEVQAIRRVRQMGQRSVPQRGPMRRRHRLPEFDDR